ncbi:MAG: exopolysaccharide biosynthesis polyprenyl glycosylphosphotransferase [Verrucomicrobia bacterium]|nr:exopolysaccharide biosynthesis polyprenyl glycosylphosphotransferase [Verrucomicrobiota bacterium]
MKKNTTRNTAYGLFALDVVTSILVFNIVARFRGLELADHLILAPLALPIGATVLAIYLIEGYKDRTDMLSVDYTSQHTIALIGAMLTTLIVTYVVLRDGYEMQSSRAVIALSFIALIPLTIGYRRVIYQSALAAKGDRSLVFLGDQASCEAFHTECQKMGMYQRVIFSVVSEDSAAPFSPQAGQPLRPFAEVLDDIQAGRIAVEAIILRESARELVPDMSRRLVHLYFSGIPTYTLELFHQVYWQKIPIYRLNQTWLFQEGFQIAREPVFERIKRISDIVLSALGLVLASPVIALGAIAIWLEDRGPIFFFQNRVGRNHQVFRIIKLRTMRVRETAGDLYTQPGDSRITRVGRFLRTTRIDEFPQMWNVLVGDMSLIGPRAEWDRLVENYERDIPCYHFRHLVKPGITGWAQVNYPYGANLEDTIRKLEYDLYYIRHFSFLLDATIVLKTIHIMLFGKGR